MTRGADRRISTLQLADEALITGNGGIAEAVQLYARAGRLRRATDLQAFQALLVETVQSWPQE